MWVANCSNSIVISSSVDRKLLRKPLLLICPPLAIMFKTTNNQYNMKLKKIIFLGFLFLASSLEAQTDFRQGYVININSDTLKGVIDYRGDLLMSEICRFKINFTENEIKYTPNDIIEYRFNDSKYFISREIEGKKVFLEFLIKGKVNIYYLRDDTGDHYFLEKDSSGLVEIPYEESIQSVDNKTYLYESKKHIGLLKYYMQDVPSFQSSIEKMGKPDHRSLVKIAENYHNKVCKDASCIIYEKKAPVLKISFEIAGGVCSGLDYDTRKPINKKYFQGETSAGVYSGFEYSTIGVVNNSYFQTGIITHLCLFRSNENFYLRTGILYSSVEAYNRLERQYTYEDTKLEYTEITKSSDPFRMSLYKIPIQLEYVYPSGIIRPRLVYGINIYRPLTAGATTFSIIGGLNIKLNKSFYLTANYDFEYIGLIPSEKGPQSILCGLQISL